MFSSVNRSRRQSHRAARSGLRAALVCALCAALLSGAQAPSKQEPAIRATTRLVQVSVLVQDSRGEPVTNLRKEDFTLLDEGKQEEIQVFSLERMEAPAAAAAPLPPGTYSNRLEHRAAPSNPTVILLDGLNTLIEDQAYARMQVTKFLQQIQPDDRVALYTLSNRLRVVHDFTRDAASLLRALDRAAGRTAADLSTPEMPRGETGDPEFADLEAWFRLADLRERDAYQVNRTRRTILALEAVARHLSRIPGRKNLVWVSASFPISLGYEDLRMRGQYSYQATEQRSFIAEVERLARALNLANLAIYPVDARGLVGPYTQSAVEPDLDREAAYTGRSRRATQGSAFPAVVPTTDTMNLLADATGGRAFYNTNDIRGAIRRSIDESRAVYILGFYPTHNRWNGRYRRLRVQVNDSALRVRHRTGYYALADTAPSAQQRQEALADAAEFPLDASELSLTVRIGREGASLKLELSAEPRGIQLEKEGDRWRAGLDFLFVQTAADGARLSTQQQTLPLNLSAAQLPIFSAEGLTVTKTLPAAEGARQLRIVVRDASSGALGSVSIPLAAQ
jgi:VWFA-related protein